MHLRASRVRPLLRSFFPRNYRVCVSPLSFSPPPATRRHSSWLGMPTRAFSAAAPDAVAAQNSFITDSLFQDAQLHEHTKRALTKMGLRLMTEIQRDTLKAAVSGMDVLARARTGTGKTVAFLVPALERLVQNQSRGPPRSSVGVLIVSPTRELSEQIAGQARQLANFHDNIAVQCVTGGNRKPRSNMVTFLAHKKPVVLICTPGRIMDLLTNYGLKDHIRQVGLLVLDEADVLLEMGFRDQIEQLAKLLPAKRQTLLFSATMPVPLRQVMMRAMNPKHVVVDCVGDVDQTQATHSHVQQTFVVVPSSRIVMSTIEVLFQALESDPNAKIIAFFTTARATGLYSKLFSAMAHKFDSAEIHSRLSQSSRNKASEKFRKMKRGVLFSSDVSARGVDYPAVTHVIQFGLPPNREQYIHRLGRTGRAGESGKGWLVLAEFEQEFLKSIKDLKVTKEPQLRALMGKPPSSATRSLLDPVLKRVNTNDSLFSIAQKAYGATLGFYSGHRAIKLSRTELVEQVNGLSKQFGLAEVPALQARAVGKMRLKGVPGIRIQKGVY